MENFEIHGRCTLKRATNVYVCIYAMHLWMYECMYMCMYVLAMCILHRAIYVLYWQSLDRSKSNKWVVGLRSWGVEPIQKLN